MLVFLEKVREKRIERIQAGVQNLYDYGLNICYDEVVTCAKGKLLCRSHIAAAMVKSGIVRSFRNAYKLFLGDHKEFIPSNFPSASEAIQCIRKEGGLSFWAHPARPDFLERLKILTNEGLDGIEAYGLWPQKHAKFFRQTAEAQNLLISGGSDWHGYAQSRLGDFWVEATRVQELLSFWEILG